MKTNISKENKMNSHKDISEKRASFCNSAVTGLFGIFSAHPYISMLLICIISTMPFCAASSNISSAFPIIMFFFYCVSAGLIVPRICSKYKLKDPLPVILTIAASAIGAPVFLYYRNQENKLLFVFAFGCIMLTAYYLAFHTKKMSRRFNSLLIMGMGFMVKLCYVLGTSISDRQHDVGYFEPSKETAPEHLGYISYLFYNHHLYDGDYREIFQYCHPPLHHALCAAWVGFLNRVLGVDIENAVESAQVLPLFYSMAIIITAYKIFRYFKLEGKALYIPLIITAFHPCFTYLSAFMNNDALTWALTMGAILCTLQWYKAPTIANIIKIALCLGLGMMTKLSAALAAFPIAFVFIIVFFQSIKTSWKKNLGQYAVFLTVCFPLGMWFPIRGLIRWGIPLTYVQQLPEMDQSIKGITFWERITDFSLKQVQNVYENWMWRDESGALQSFNEHNPLIAILKNSIFGEFINGNNFPGMAYMDTVCKILFWLGVALAAGAFMAMIVYLFRKTAADRIEKGFITFFHIVLIINLYILSKNYPMVCSMNFRYLMPTVVTGALFLGYAVSELENSPKSAVKALRVPVYFAVIAFSALSTYVYMVVASTT